MDNGFSVPKPASSRVLHIVMIIAAINMLTAANARFVQAFPGGGQDFLDRWTGASKWVQEGLSPYHPEVTDLAQQMIYGRPAQPELGEDLHHFVYPFHSMIFFAPFGFLEFPQARALWMTVLEFSIVGLVVVSLRLIRWEIFTWQTTLLAIFSFVWVYGAHTLLVGQFSGLNALIIALSLWALENRWDFLAGILLTLSTTKPQMVVLLIPFLLLWAISAKRWHLIVGFSLSLTVLMGISLLLLPTWPIEMWAQLSNYPDYAVSISPVEMIGEFFPSLAGWGTTVANGLIILTLVWAGWQAKGQTGRPLLWAALLAIVVTNLIIPRTTTSNYMMMLPAFFLTVLMVAQAVPRFGGWLSVFFLLILFFGGWMLFFASFVEGTFPKHLVFFPLPYLCLFGLLWAFPRWVHAGDSDD